MSDRSDFARLEFILVRIREIDMSLKRHGTVQKTLEDFEGRNAVLMCLFQIGETLQKIKKPEWRNILPAKEAYLFRNIVAHDYDAIKRNI